MTKRNQRGVAVNPERMAAGRYSVAALNFSLQAGLYLGFQLRPFRFVFGEEPSVDCRGWLNQTGIPWASGALRSCGLDVS
jgi:hypothetical protein